MSAPVAGGFSVGAAMSVGEGSTLHLGVLRFVRTYWVRVLAISVLVLIPCFWHARIEAGDLPSHVYNAWLAQLIGKGQAPGLYIARQWNNVLFDVALLSAAKVAGFAAAQKIVASACVLIFFWGVFAFVGAVSGCAPWFLTPCIAMLAYGYSFSMGFMNYYVSIGLACFGLAAGWRGGAGNWLVAAVFAPLVYLAHPIGFLWFVGALTYRVLRKNLPGWTKAFVPLTALSPFVAAHWYLVHRAKFPIDRSGPPFYWMNGADQVATYGERYISLAWVALIFGALCVGVDVYVRLRRNSEGGLRHFLLPLELYAVAFFATALLPENLHPSIYQGWIGLVVSRLTSISAILGLCLMGSLRPRKWHFVGFSVLAVVFFDFYYQDTLWLNRLEANAETAVSRLPYGTRIIPTIAADPEWRTPFIGHIADRACIGHCFTYSNYEPSSGQFRVRVDPRGSPIVVASEEESEDMEGGTYEIQDTDPPLKQLYQCDPGDLTKLCIHDLAVGETIGELGLQPSN